MDSLDLAYAAGIIDGEGWIGMSTSEPKGKARSPVFQCCVVVRMTDAEVPVWFAEQFGGRVLAIESKTGGRLIHHWSLTAGRAAAFCRQIRPYLRIKHRQAELVFRYREDERLEHARHGGNGVRVPPAEIAVKREYAAEFAGLNGRAEP